MRAHSQALTLSIVIPAYNEENYIWSCLSAIDKQTIKPLEVIVVDNNCTDKTIEIAKKFQLVRVLEEPIQGRTVSRNRGFNAARGDIIGRIDADSIIAPNWVERVIADFNESSIEGVTGLAQTRVLLGFKHLHSTFWTRIYFWTTRSIYHIKTMWGANMAIRRSAWEQVKSFTAPDGSHVHEDQDLSFVLVGHGGRIRQDNKLLIKTEGGSYLYWPKFWPYFKKNFHMKHYHDKLGTLSNAAELKISFWDTLGSGLIGWFFTSLFIVYSLVSWPIFALILRRKDIFKEDR